MKNLTVVFFLLAFMQRTSAQIVDTLGGTYLFASIACADSILVNDGEMPLAYDTANRGLIRYIAETTRDLDTNVSYVLSNGTRIVRIEHLRSLFGPDRYSKIHHPDQGLTLFIISRDLRLILVLYAGLGGWHERYFFRQPAPVTAGAYDALHDRPILGVIHDPDQRSLRDLLYELLPQNESEK